MAEKKIRKRRKVSLETLDFDLPDEENLDEEVTNTNMGPLIETPKEHEIVTINEFRLIEDQKTEISKDRAININTHSPKFKVIISGLLVLVIGFVFMASSKNNVTKEKVIDQNKSIAKGYNEDNLETYKSSSNDKLPIFSVISSAAALKQPDLRSKSTPKPIKKAKKRYKKKRTSKRKNTQRKVLWQDSSLDISQGIENNIIENAVLLSNIMSGREVNIVKVRLYGDSQALGLDYPQNTIFLAKYDGRLRSGRVDLNFYKALLPNNTSRDIKAYAVTNSQRGIRADTQISSKVGNRSKKTLFRAAKTALSYGSGGLSQQIVSDVGRETIDEVDDATEITRTTLVKKGVNLSIKFIKK